MRFLVLRRAYRKVPALPASWDQARCSPEIFRDVPRMVAAYINPAGQGFRARAK